MQVDLLHLPANGQCLVEPSCSSRHCPLAGRCKRSTCMGAETSCGARSCQPEEVLSAVALVCAWIERIVTKTFMKFPRGGAFPPGGRVEALDWGAQGGGSLMDTFIVPIFEF